ncbi:MAG: DUF2332 domain-containing protein [Phycisphaerales bacterium]|nr:DUF2332 domain-containing protein [Phycisphaerales bacterium]
MDAETARKSLAHFGQICEGESPLYAMLAARAAESAEAVELAAGASSGQPASNMLFGSVHFLLLSGVQGDLVRYYPSLGGSTEGAAADDIWAAFEAFFRAHSEEIRGLIGARRVQTNEVNRCGVMLPAFCEACAAFGDAPLQLIEVGASAGLALGLDRYRYEYDDGLIVGGASPVVVRTALHGPYKPPRRALPRIADRIGVDIAPGNVLDDDGMRWQEALIWPDQMDRIERHRAAVAVMRETPPTIIAGDGLEIAPRLALEAPESVIPCVFHSHAIYQMKDAWLQEFTERLAAVGAKRDLARVSLEWLRDDAGPRLRLTTWRGGVEKTRLLAEAHHHGRWMRWVEAQNA